LLSDDASKNAAQKPDVIAELFIGGGGH
jgi:hypothetical protein